MTLINIQQTSRMIELSSFSNPMRDTLIFLILKDIILLVTSLNAGIDMHMLPLLNILKCANCLVTEVLNMER